MNKTSIMHVRVAFGTGWVETPVLYVAGCWRVTRPISSRTLRASVCGYMVTHAPSTRRASETIRTLSTAKRLCQLLDERMPRFRSVKHLTMQHRAVWEKTYREVMEPKGRA